jgi:hypothetical protein
MAGEKAKENKRLIAACAACGKEQSVELLTGRVIGFGRGKRIVPVCQSCLDAGWTPPDPEDSDRQARPQR